MLGTVANTGQYIASCAVLASIYRSMLLTVENASKHLAPCSEMWTILASIYLGPCLEQWTILANI